MSQNPLTRRTLIGGGLLVGLGWVAAVSWGHRPLGKPAESPFLGPSARGTLEASLEALLPDGAPFVAVAADVDRFLAGGDPVVGGQLILALGVLEHLGGGTFRRFSRLGREERTAVLEGWRTSAFGPKRQIAEALRKVALFSWYAREETWAGIGYDGPWVGR